jgi:hypothetical protein
LNITVRITRDENAEYFGTETGCEVQVPFESYVAGVVASEVGNSALEVCKAQAVASRTFAVSKGVLTGKVITDASSTDQAYRAARLESGLYPNAKLAAKDTEGQILTYNGKPINAVYSACNGGRTVSSQERWGGVRPYLIAQDDPWDNAEKCTGHGVGMSQRGAKAMAAAGKDYREILAFYYPGTALTAIEEKGDDQKMVTAKQFIEQVKIPLNEGWGYIYGTWGSLWTKEKQQAATREMTIKYGSRWIGKMVTDCSGLVRWALKQLGVDVVHHATYLYTDWCRAKGQLQNGRRTDGQPLKPGSLVFLKGAEEKIHHVGVYVGDGIVIEAKGTQAGVITSGLEKWDHWGELKVVDYTNGEIVLPSDAEAKAAVRAEVTNPGKWLNLRARPDSDSQRIATIDPGTIVDILTEDQGWYQIRTGGRIGWVDGKYLTILSQEEEPPEEAQETAPEEVPVEVRSSVITDLETILTGLSDLENLVADVLRRL